MWFLCHTISQMVFFFFFNLNKIHQSNFSNEVFVFWASQKKKKMYLYFGNDLRNISCELVIYGTHEEQIIFFSLFQRTFQNFYVNQESPNNFFSCFYNQHEELHKLSYRRTISELSLTCSLSSLVALLCVCSSNCQSSTSTKVFVFLVHGNPLWASFFFLLMP